MELPEYPSLYTMKCLRLRNAILLGYTMGEVYVSSLPLAIDLVNVCINVWNVEISSIDDIGENRL